ncbi:MAG: peptidase [Ignavibacteriales bacterium]|nr:peptidase [Ignavibacteriales bacterium]
MKDQIRFLLLTVLFLFASLTEISAQQKFYVNLNDRADDLFKVTLVPEKLTEQNKIYQFASTAPGTYQTMDIGRYVRSFKAYDETGNELGSKQISTNQWELEEPVKTKKIVYTIAETWDTPVKEHSVYAMSGTSLENDHVLVNGQCVFGYFHGMQKTPIKIKLDYPKEWLAGTALNLDKEGFYDAPDYDYVVDSPILLGNLTKATTKIENTSVDVYTYSKTGKVSSDQILILLEDMLTATSQFTQGLPVDRYTFLFHFENFSSGAWEHNFSSEYVFNELPLEGAYAKEIKSTAAHEFYHVITPLNIHSELVGNFNFEKPTMSQHIWLYEGVTEWASDILQLRDYLTSLDDFLAEIKTKLIMNDNYDPAISLVDLSLHSTERQDQYGNIYQKGAVVACLLDIRLLELSKGKKGLREVLNQLYKDYGANKAFSEKDFFDEFVNRTYPEIADFINRYIKGTDKLPVADYFENLGIEYKEFVGIDSSKISLGFGIGLKDNKFVVTKVDNITEDGLRTNDFIIKVNGEEVTLQNAQTKFAFMKNMKVGDSFVLTIERNGTQKEVQCFMIPKSIKHQFKVLDTASDQQLELRSAWMKNL